LILDIVLSKKAWSIIESDGITKTLFGASAANGTFGFEITLNKKGKYSFMVSFQGNEKMYEDSNKKQQFQ